jgi:hypothetical protein
MIDFDRIESEKEHLKKKYYSAKPFPFLILKDVCDTAKINELYLNIPELENKSRDYMFAGQKFEKSNYQTLGPLFKELQEDLRSMRMNDFLSFLTNKETFVDPVNHGGGLHQGKKNSFLDMHLDYNYHPLNKNWWREMNLLLYLNKNWKPEHKGQLKLRDLRTDETTELEVDFNTLIIQQCGDYTLHGYDFTNFPEGLFRTSIATYAFTKHVRQLYKPRTTDWIPEKEGDGKFKRFIGRNFHRVVKLKNTFLGSGTSKNK